MTAAFVIGVTGLLILAFVAGALVEWAKPGGHSDTQDQLRDAHRELARRSTGSVGNYTRDSA